MFTSKNPFSGAVLHTIPEHTPSEVEQKLENSQRAFQVMRRLPFKERAVFAINAAGILDNEKIRLARIITEEMGKNIGDAEAEIAKCAFVCRYYAENAERHLRNEEILTNAKRSFVSFQPLGPVLAIMPWNFPFWQVFRFAAPALMAGNTGLLKHAANVPGCALAIEEILKRAGLPEGAFQTLLIESRRVADIIQDDRVKAVTLTGSEEAGRIVASQAGAQIKKTVLELGGSDPFIIMPSANLENAVRAGVRSRMLNNGQSCIAAKRFIIADSVYGECEKMYVEGVKSLRIGDPMDRQTEIGPLASEKQLLDLEKQVQRAVEAGGRVLTGGQRVPGQQTTFEPTVIAGVPRGGMIAREEIFGPVAMLFRARDAADAVDIANETPFGLGASVWTELPAEQQQFMTGIEAGQVFVNAMVASDPRVPFGGVKRSGFGRELGEAGIREFVNYKTVWCA